MLSYSTYSEEIKVSIIIPVYNMEKYIRQCLQSVINQTLQEIEAICIDDASTDASLSIIQEYADMDRRIKVIIYNTNKSASQARKDGALQAKGEYIMFLDGDDYIEKDACQGLYDAIKNRDVDILQFGTKIVNVGHASEERIANLEKILLPYYGRLEGKEVFKGCFIDKKYRFTIWNKIYKGELCKKAFTCVKDGSYQKAQDLYAFFILCFFAKSYYGIEETYYDYCFGAGITGNDELSLPQMERYCQSVYAAEAIQEFAAEQDVRSLKDVTDAIRKDLLNDCVSNWFEHVMPQNAAKGFDILCQFWGRKEIVALLCGKYYSQRKLLAEKIDGAQSVECQTGRSIKTIGIFYHRFIAGGVQRVISLLIPMYIEMGYKVVLFTDEISEENEYRLPKEAERVILPSSLTIHKSRYMERAEMFLAKAEGYRIDVMHYHAASSSMCLFDILLMKLHGIPVILSVHETPFSSLLTMNMDIADRPVVYRLADRVTVLSKADQKYWNCLGVAAVYMPNPLHTQLIDRDLSEVGKNKILWIGRLDAATKRCMDVIPIMKYVVQYIPDAQLLVVGNEVTPGIRKRMQAEAEKNGLEKNVLLCGYDAEVDKYYRLCELHMLTSVSESFSMTISESKAYGMPLVMYELPSIEFFREKRGIVSVPQGDVKMMARAVVRILKDEDYKRQLQQEAHDSLGKFLAVDLKKEWNKVFWDVGGGRENHELSYGDKLTGIMLESFLQHYRYGVAANIREKNGMRKRNKELQNAMEKQEREFQSALEKQEQELRKIEHSWDFRIGHFLFFIPHKIVGYIRNIRKRKANI